MKKRCFQLLLFPTGFPRRELTVSQTGINFSLKENPWYSVSEILDRKEKRQDVEKRVYQSSSVLSWPRNDRQHWSPGQQDMKIGTKMFTYLQYCWHVWNYFFLLMQHKMYLKLKTLYFPFRNTLFKKATAFFYW